MHDLILKGVRVLPSINMPEKSQLEFPDFDNIDQIESKIKKITDGKSE